RPRTPAETGTSPSCPRRARRVPRRRGASTGPNGSEHCARLDRDALNPIAPSQIFAAAKADVVGARGARPIAILAPARELVVDARVVGTSHRSAKVRVAARLVANVGPLPHVAAHVEEAGE